MSQCLINLISSPFLSAIRCGSLVFLPPQRAGSQLIQLLLTPFKTCAEPCLCCVLGFIATNKFSSSFPLSWDLFPRSGILGSCNSIAAAALNDIFVPAICQRNDFSSQHMRRGKDTFLNVSTVALYH